MQTLHLLLEWEKIAKKKPQRDHLSLGFYLTPFYEIRLALGTVDTDLPFSSGNPDLLSAAGTLVNVELAGLGYFEFQVLKTFPDPEFQIQILLVLLKPFPDLLGQHPVIAKNQAQRPQQIQNMGPEK